jgi:hypothetical protein
MARRIVPRHRHHRSEQHGPTECARAHGLARYAIGELVVVVVAEALVIVKADGALVVALFLRQILTHDQSAPRPRQSPTRTCSVLQPRPKCTTPASITHMYMQRVTTTVSKEHAYQHDAERGWTRGQQGVDAVRPQTPPPPKPYTSSQTRNQNGSARH